MSRGVKQSHVVWNIVTWCETKSRGVKQSHVVWNIDTWCEAEYNHCYYMAIISHSIRVSLKTLIIRLALCYTYCTNSLSLYSTQWWSFVKQYADILTSKIKNITAFSNLRQWEQFGSLWTIQNIPKIREWRQEPQLSLAWQVCWWKRYQISLKRLHIRISSKLQFQVKQDRLSRGILY